MESNQTELYGIMESFKKLIQDWIIWKKIVLNPSSRDNPNSELKENLEELLKKVLEVQTAITEWTEKLELVLNAHHLFDPYRFYRLLNPSSQLEEKLEEKLKEKSRKLQAAQFALNITALGLKENLELVLELSSQNDSIAELKETLQETIPEVQHGMFLAAIRLRKILLS